MAIKLPNPFKRSRPIEQRSSYLDILTEAAYKAVEGRTSTADALAVVESCSSLIADPFLVASVDGRPVANTTLHDMARSLLRRGECVYALDVVDGELELLRACAWDVQGSVPSSSRWIYRLDIPTPQTIISRTLPAEAVIHVRLDSQAVAPWRGRAPWQSADLTADAMALMEKAIGDESRIYAGRVWIAPDGASQAQAQAMANTVAALKGGKQVVAETTAAGFGQGAAAAPPSSKDWRPEPSGPKHDAGNVQMRGQLEDSISAAYGIAPAYHNRQATAPALREVKRLAFLDRTIPLASLIAEELADKLDSPNYRIHWPNLADQSVDVHLRIRAAKDASEIGLPMLTLGLPEPTQTPEPVRVPI